MFNHWQSNVEQIHEPELGLTYELTGPYPIRALGNIGTREFFFHAKHSNWSFEMSDDLRDLPSDTGNSPVFTLAARRKFADEMNPSDVKTIIRECASLFNKLTSNHL